MEENIKFTDEEIRTIARDVIRGVIRRLSPDNNINSKFSIVEKDGIIEFVYKTADGNASIHYSPQQRIEEILRETERWAIEYLAEAIPPEYFLSSVSQHLYWDTENKEIITLIEKLSSTFKTAFSKLEEASLKLSTLAEMEGLKSFSKLNLKSDEIEKYKEFARKVNEVKPLWDYIIKYFEEHGYTSDCLNVSREDDFRNLAKGNELKQTLLGAVFKRQMFYTKEKSSKEEPELQPLGFALKHAKILVNIEGKHYSLINIYYTGMKHLRHEALLLD